MEGVKSKPLNPVERYRQIGDLKIYRLLLQWIWVSGIYNYISRSIIITMGIKEDMAWNRVPTYIHSRYRDQCEEEITLFIFSNIDRWIAEVAHELSFFFSFIFWGKRMSTCDIELKLIYFFLI